MTQPRFAVPPRFLLTCPIHGEQYPYMICTHIMAYTAAIYHVMRAPEESEVGEILCQPCTDRFRRYEQGDLSVSATLADSLKILCAGHCEAYLKTWQKSGVVH